MLIAVIASLTIWQAPASTTPSRQPKSGPLKRLTLAREGFRRIFKLDGRFEEAEEVSTVGEIPYKVVELFPVGKAGVRLIFGISNNSGKWILAHQSMKGKVASTDWLINLIEIKGGKDGKPGSLRGLMRSQGVSLPPALPLDVLKVVDQPKAYAMYRSDFHGGYTAAWVLFPNGTESKRELHDPLTTRLANGQNSRTGSYPISRFEADIVLKKKTHR